MKKWEKSILARQLSSERDIIRRLEKSYKEALDEIDMRILALKARPQTQSVIYQLQYQEALRKQVHDVYSKMTAAWYKDIKTYLGDCYEDAFFSTMYSLHQQGIPLIIPFDQEAAAEAASMDYGILGDTLSDRLYKNTYTVADRTIKHITVGIASNASYGSIAANIANAANISLTNALRITRTEAHRVTQTVQYETVKKARSCGADVVKQWDSTLDNRTRPSHAALDGQIREIDEPFKVPTNGHEAEHPGAFGIASEDINCRCVCLQRARWAIDQTELEKYVGDLDGMDDDQLDKMAGSLGVTRDELIRKSNGVIEPDGSVNHRISSTSYNDFKKKYWERSRTVDRKSGTGYNSIKEWDKNGTARASYYAITHEAIVGVPLLEFEGFSPKQNRTVQRSCRRVLDKVTGYEIGTEGALLLSTQNFTQIGDITIGEVGHVKPPQSNKQHILVHNHGDNNTFSIEDIRSFINRQKAEALIAVGNKGSLYALQKVETTDVEGFTIFLNFANDSKMISGHSYYEIEDLYRKGQDIPKTLNISIDELYTSLEDYSKYIIERMEAYGFRYFKVDSDSNRPG